MKVKTYLFFVTEVGLAHIVRTLAVAEELQKRGNNVIFALPKRRWFVAKKSPVQLIDIEGYATSESMEIIKVAKDLRRLRRLIKQELQIIKKYEPDALFVDTRITALFAGLISKRKVFMFGGSDAVPGFSYFPKNILPGWLFTLLKPFIPTIIKSIQLSFLKHSFEITKDYGQPITHDEIIQKPFYIIPEIEGYLSQSKTIVKHAYVNPPSWHGFKAEEPAWLNKIHPDKNTIYLTFGGTGFDGTKLVRLSQALTNEGFRVIVSTGNLVPVSAFPKINNLFVAKFLPGREVTSRVDLVVCHGGYGTVMEAILASKPVISLPFNPDQVIHANRISELGMGECITHINIRDLIYLATLDWEAFQVIATRVKYQEVVMQTKKVFENYNHYIKNIKKFNKQIHPVDGAVESASIIERLT